ncbi:MAG: hypothetical protein U0787_01585 [Polyangia bacterium]
MANEAGIPGRAIGAIEIFSNVHCGRAADAAWDAGLDSLPDVHAWPSRCCACCHSWMKPRRRANVRRAPSTRLPVPCRR